MDKEFNVVGMLPERCVYVRAVKPQNLPKELQGEVQGLEYVYVIHSEDGEPLAAVKDRDLAFAVARTNDLVPVSAH